MYYGLLGLAGKVSAPSFTGILDTYTGASAAYSAARRLSYSYTGALIRVRRSSDNTEQDIGYNGSNVLDESALTSFVGSGNGFVTKLYDQSGNGRDQSQSTAANQPRIVNSGTIDKKNGNVAMYFNYANQRYLKASSTSILNIQDCISTFSVASYTEFVNYGHIISKGYDDSGVYSLGNFSSSSYMQIWIETDRFSYSSQTTSLNTQYLFSNINKTGTNGIKLYQNNSLYGQSTTTNDLTGSNSYYSTIGRNDKDANYYMNGYIQEIILYPTDQTSNLSGINSNINTFYSIY